MEEDKMMVDPVSGNEVPPGGTAEGVRDDIDAKLSEGEYVIPAHVVNYYGEDILEELIENAETRLREMGEEIPVDPEAVEGDEMEEEEEEEDVMSDDDLPAGVSKEDLLEFENIMAETASYATGGLVVRRGTLKLADGGKVTRADLQRDVEPFVGSDWEYFGSSLFDQDTGELTGTDRVDIKTYKNDRGRTTQITFVDGEPIGRIPEGFYPVGEKPQEVAESAAEAVTQPKQERSEGGSPFGPEGGLEEPGVEGAAESVKKLSNFGPWGGENPYNLDADQLLAGAQKASRNAGIINLVGKAGVVIHPMVAAGAAAAKGMSVSNLRAAQLVAEAKGYTDVAAEIDTMVANIGGDKGMFDMFASGEKKFESWKSAYEMAESPTGSTSTSVSSGSSGGSGGSGSSGGSSYSGSSSSSGSSGGSEGGNPFSQGASYKDEESTPTVQETSVGYGDNVSGSGSTTNNSQTDFVTRDPTQDSPDVGYSTPASDNAVDTSSAGSFSRDENDYTFAKGGLVKKRQATPRKRTPK